MDATTVTILAISMIFAATTLGSALVLFIRRQLSDRVSNLILGFASGIMIAAGIFGLLLPAMDEASVYYEKIAFVPVLVGFLVGGLLLFGLDRLIPHLHHAQEDEEGLPTKKVSRPLKFLFAVTIHNIPEGLSVGFACGLALQSQEPAAIMGALSLAIGISIQNVPEGAAVSIPLLEEGISRPKAFLGGMLSGIVEPVFALIGLGIATSIASLMPWLLAFAAGAMIYVTIEELLPSARKGGHEHFGIWAFMIGFVIMMVLEMI